MDFGSVGAADLFTPGVAPLAAPAAGDFAGSASAAASSSAKRGSGRKTSYSGYNRSVAAVANEASVFSMKLNAAAESKSAMISVERRSSLEDGDAAVNC